MATDPGARASEDSLRVICNGVQSPTVDIVSIPSLPQLLPQYQPRDEAKWISDTFTHHFPSARVILLQYDFARNPADACWLRILQEGTSLLYGLIHLRSRPDEMRRPLVFLCHSFGGMVLKQALISAKQNAEFSSLFDSTIGVLFFGCIHNHQPADFETCCLKCVAVEMRIPITKHEVSLSLKSSDKWGLLRETLDKFRQLEVSFPIWSFFESRKTSYKAHKLRPADTSLICSEPLSRLNLQNEQFLAVDMDHIQLSSFPTRSHPLFQKIITVIHGILIEHRKRQDPEAEVEEPLEYPSATPDDTISSDDCGVETPVSDSIPGNLSLSQKSGLPKLPCRSLAPHKDNPNFVGRSAVLSRMRQTLLQDASQPAKQRVFALCGLGGVGKTQTVVKFTTSHMTSYQAVLFAHADKTTSLLDDFSRFAADLGLVDPEEPNQKVSSERLKSWFETTDVPWLLIFDNADNPDSTVLADFWPKCAKGSILLTSRVKAIATKLGGEILQPLDEDHAVELLLRLIGSERKREFESEQPEGEAQGVAVHDPNDETIPAEEEKQSTLDIVQRLGCLPLGIFQAANLIVQDSCLLTDFISTYDYHGLVRGFDTMSIFNNPNEERYRHTLSTVWSMNFESLNQDSRMLLNVLSLFNPDKIQLDMLSSGAEKAYRAGYDKWAILENTRKFTMCKASVLQSSLVEQNSTYRTLSMHRLVQDACQHGMSVEDRQTTFDMAVCLLDHEWPVAPRHNRLDLSLWPRQQQLLPHALSLCSYFDECQQNQDPPLPSKRFAEFLYNVSRYIYERGLFEYAEPLLRVSEAYCLKHKDCDLILADIYGSKAAIANQINRRQIGLENFKLQYLYIQRAIESGTLKEPDIRICFALGGLGNGHQGMNNYDEAVEWYHKCFEAWEGVEGDQRLYRANLAFCLCWQGKTDEAESLLKPLISPLTDTSFRAAGIWYCLGNIEVARGQLDKAFENHLHTFRIYKAGLGENHHKTADIYHKMGWHYHARKKYDKAIEMLKQALTVYEGNPDWYANEIARTKYKLGCTLQDSGNFPEGTGLIEQAEALRRRILGGDVPPGDERSFDELVMFWSR